MRSFFTILIICSFASLLAKATSKLPVYGYVFVEFTKAEDGTIHDLGVIKGIQASIDSMALDYLKGSPDFFAPFPVGYVVAPLPFLHVEEAQPEAFSRETFAAQIPQITWEDIPLHQNANYNDLKFELLAVVKEISPDGALTIEVQNNFVAHESNILADYRNEAGLSFVHLSFYVSELYAAILRQELEKVNLYTTPEDLRMLEALQWQLARERDALLAQMTRAIVFGKNHSALFEWANLVTFSH